MAKTNFRRPWKGKDSWHVREKSAWFAYLPYLGTFLRNPPESQPSPVIRPPQKTRTGTLQHRRQHRNSTGLSGPTTATNKSHNSSTRNFFLPNQPTAQHVVQQCIPDLRHALCLLQGEHTHTYIKSTHRSLLGQYMEYLWTLSSATRESLRPYSCLLPGMRCGMWNISATVALLLKPQEKEGRQPSQLQRKVRATTTTSNKQP